MLKSSFSHISKSGGTSQLHKLLSIVEAPTYQNLIDLQSYFRLLSYYRKFVWNMRRALYKLHAIDKKNVDLNQINKEKRKKRKS